MCRPRAEMQVLRHTHESDTNRSHMALLTAGDGQDGRVHGGVVQGFAAVRGAGPQPRRRRRLLQGPLLYPGPETDSADSKFLVL